MEEYGNALNTTTPLGWVEDFEDKSEESRFIGSVTLTYDLPVKGLKYELRAGGNMRSKERRRFWGLNTFQGKAANGALQISNLNTKSYQVNNLLRFNRSFNKEKNISVETIEDTLKSVSNIGEFSSAISLNMIVKNLD